MSKNQTKFSIALRFFHWTSVLMMVVVYSSIWARKLFEKTTSEYKLMMTLHIGLGIVLLAWLLFRLMAYFIGRRPPIVPTVPAWQANALKLMLGCQWGLMAVLPLSGWVMGNAKGRAVNVFGIQLPNLVEKNETIVKMLDGLHGMMGKVLFVLIAMHTLMALFHHFFKKDNALRRML